MKKSLIEIMFPESAKMLGTKEEFEKSRYRSNQPIPTPNDWSKWYSHTSNKELTNNQ